MLDDIESKDQIEGEAFKLIQPAVAIEVCLDKLSIGVVSSTFAWHFNIHAITQLRSILNHVRA